MAPDAQSLAPLQSISESPAPAWHVPALSQAYVVPPPSVPLDRQHVSPPVPPTVHVDPPHAIAWPPPASPPPVLPLASLASSWPASLLPPPTLPLLLSLRVVPVVLSVKTVVALFDVIVTVVPPLKETVVVAPVVETPWLLDELP